MQSLYNEKQLIFLQDGSNRTLSKDQILGAYSHMTYYLQNLHYISTYIYFIDVFIQDISKNPKIKLIRLLH